jgi:hypothetical protein
MNLFKALGIALLLILAGCHTGPEYNYPADIKQMCNDNVWGAKHCIEGVTGKGLNEKSDLKLEKHPGQKKFADGWAWQSPEWNNIWVYGLTGRSANGDYWIEVGSNPQTGGDVNQKIVNHEGGHFWLMSNWNDWGHNPKYKPCFIYWNDPKAGIRFMATDVEIRGQLMDLVTFDPVPEAQH